MPSDPPRFGRLTPSHDYLPMPLSGYSMIPKGRKVIEVLLSLHVRIIYTWLLIIFSAIFF